MERRSFLGTLGAMGTAALAGCNAVGVGSTPTRTSSPTPTAPRRKEVRMSGANAAGLLYFNPIGLYVEPGETVTWRASSGQHSTKSFHPEYGDELRIPEDAEPWYSGAVSYSTYERTFEVEGTYDYYCSIHYNHSMVGRLVVGEPGGPAEGTHTPYGRVPRAEKIVEQGTVSYSDLHTETG